jgi:SAM-dependent methyltransferase
VSVRRYAAKLDVPLEVTREARNYNAWVYGRARPFLGRRVLDMGAGIGTFTELALADGREVTALEPDTSFAAALEAEFGAHPRVEIARATTEEFRDRRPALFDAVISFNVLEHIADDQSAVQAASDLLRPGGRLLLLVPAHPLLLGDVDRALGHVRRYRRDRLRRLLGSAGFEVESLRHVNPVGALGWLVTFRLRSWPKEWPRCQYRTFDRLVPALRLLDRVPLPVGLSIWAVGRRP